MTAADKEALYHNCFNWLGSGGEFLNIDQVLSPSPEIEAKFSTLWRSGVEASGLDKEEILKGYERVTHDNPSTLSDQMLWLTEAGFSQVDVVYKYYHFCAFYAKK